MPSRKSSVDALERSDQTDTTNKNGSGVYRPVKLERVLGLAHAIGIICANVIGSGIYVSPGAVLKHAGSNGLSLVLWSGAGLLTALISTVDVELGTTFQHSGEKYLYILEFWGEFPAFIANFCVCIIGVSISRAIKALTFSAYLLQPFFLGCPIPNLALRLVGMSMLMFIGFVNSRRVTTVAGCQVVFALLNIGALIIISCLGLQHIVTKEVALNAGFEGSTHSPGSIVFGIYAGYFAFAGSNLVNYVLSEVKAPTRNVPRAIYISLLFITTLYLLVNVAFLAVLGPEKMLMSDAVAVSFAFETMGKVGWIMSIIISGTVASSTNASLLAISRMGYEAGKRGHFPRIFGMISVDYKSPVVNILLQTALSLMLVISGDLFDILNFVTLAYGTLIILKTAGLLRHRILHPKVVRPFKTPLVILVLALVVESAVFLVMPLLTRPLLVLMANGVVLGMGTPCYLIFVVWKGRQAVLGKWIDSATRLLQKVMMCVPEDTDDRNINGEIPK